MTGFPEPDTIEILTEWLTFIGKPSNLAVYKRPWRGGRMRIERTRLNGKRVVRLQWSKCPVKPGTNTTLTRSFFFDNVYPADRSAWQGTCRAIAENYARMLGAFKDSL